jgi:integrase
MAARRGNREGSKPTQRADGRWQQSVAWTDQHGRPQRTYVYGKTRSEVRTKLKAVVERLDRGQPARDDQRTLAAFTEHWIGSSLAASDRKPSTKAGYETLARKHVIGSSLGGMSLGRIKPSHIEGWVFELRARKLSESTVRSIYTVLRAVLDTAVRDGLLATNPCAAVTRPRVAHQEAQCLTPDQLRTLLDNAAAGRYAPLFLLLARTGMRRGEALAVQWSDVDFKKHEVRVRGTLARVNGELTVTTPKTATSRRTLPMGEVVEGIFHDLLARQKTERLAAGTKWTGCRPGTGFVFTTEFGGPSDPRNALRALKSAGRAAKLPTIGLHTLRHTAATTMLNNGVPIHVVSRLLGHSSIAITVDTYGHVSSDDSRAAMDALAAALG